eukprot:9492850-Pyramimonas_sp.AAC.1
MSASEPTTEECILDQQTSVSTVHQKASPCPKAVPRSPRRTRKPILAFRDNDLATLGGAISKKP